VTHSRVSEEERQGTFLNLGRLGEAHIIDAFEKIGVSGKQ